ncbi:MAG TPA: ABC transporter permease [Bryobacteraceae bacterium]|jgi:predicted permease
MGSDLLYKLRVLFRRRAVEADLDDELGFHLEQQARKYRQAGLPPEEVSRRLRLDFGGPDQIREECRDAWGVRMVRDCAQDLRYAWRMLRRSPGFTAVAVLSLALGIGANTAIFTLIESTLLRPITVKDAGRLRLLTWREQDGGWVAPNLGYLSSTFGSIYEQHLTADGGIMHTDFSPPVSQELLRDNTVFDPLFAFKELGRSTAIVDGNAELVNCFLVSGEFYRGMEVSPVIGRAIGPENDVRTREGQVAMISYEYWTRRFARSPSIIGRTIVLNQVPLTVIGVNPEYFTGIEPGGHFEIWAPLNLAPAVSGRPWLDDARQWQTPMMGRLKPGVSDPQAQSQLDAIFQAGVDANPGPIGALLKDPAKRPRFILQSADRGVDYLNERYRGPLLTLLSLAGLVLLIACANVANLLLAKSAVRQREISLRLALGAGRWRIVRQLLTEGLLLASMAGIAGVFFGYCTRNAVPALLATPWKPSPFDTAFDPKVLLMSIAITFFTGVLFSLAPVWQSRRVEVNDALKESSRGTASLSKLRIGRLLVVFQVALSVLLLAGAGLCVKTLLNLKKTPLGFNPARVMLFTLDLPPLFFPVDHAGALLTELRQRLDTIPGVQSATFSSYALMSGRFASTSVKLAGEAESDLSPSHVNNVAVHFVGARFLNTMGIPILFGRDIDEHDSPGTPRAAVVNREFARQFFHSENPIGEIFMDYNTTYQIVGICGDSLDRLRDPFKLGFYASWVQSPRAGQIVFELKIAGDEAGVVRQIPEAVRSVDSRLVVTDVRTQTQQIEDILSQERLMASFASVFGSLALILAGIGIYGVMAYAVARRTNEIGIRVALGARPRSVAWMVLRETLVLAAAGVSIGVPIVLGLSPIADHLLAPGWTNSFLYGMKPNDLSTIAFAVLVLAWAVLLAGYFPACRAARVDPMTALRHD